MTTSLSPTVFREYDVRGVVDRDLTDDAVLTIARAFAAQVHEAGGQSVALGRDCRTSGERFARQVVAGLVEAGLDVVDLGVVPTPLTYFAANTLGVDALCMVTGSHNPPEYNGLKLGIGTSTFHGEAVQELRRRAESGRFFAAARPGAVRRHDAVDAYRAAVRGALRMGDRRLKVVVDAGNGTGGVVAVPLFESLGVEVVPLYIEMDGRFPNHHPDPTVEENLADLGAKVVETGADLGIAYDGDADRVGAVDERGRPLWGDQLMILFARAILREAPGAAGGAEAKCSRTLFEDVAARGGRPIMWKAGHSIIRAKMKAEGAPLAGEMSGHVFFGDRWFGFDDGIYASGRLMEIVSRTGGSLSSLLGDVPRTWASPEVRVACPEEKKFEVVRRAQEWFGSRYEVITVDGVRASLPGGWALVRASNTQPLLVLRFVADSAERLDEIERFVRGRVEELKSEVGA